MTLLEQISSVETLKKAWKALNKTNDKSRGPSSVTIKSYNDNIETHLPKLSSDLLTNKFKFSPVRGTTISKKTVNAKLSSSINEDVEVERLKNLRPLRIPEIQDRVVHKAIALHLEELLTRQFNLDNECSFAYQRRIGIEQAIKQLGLYYRMGHVYILEADIVKFFDNVVAESVLSKIKSVLPDRSIDSLLDGAVKQELSNVDELKDKKVYEMYFQDSENGIPQGNALSPLLANIYLSDFDRQVIASGFKMVRYADDFVILCKTRQQAEEAYKLALEELEVKLNLRLHPMMDGSDDDAKTSIKDVRQHKFRFLSIRFDGERFTVDSKKIKSIVSRLNALSSPKERSAQFPKEQIGLYQALKKVNNAIEGWIASYAFVDCDKQIKELDKHVNIQLARIFKSFGFELQPSKLVKVKLKTHASTPLGLSDTQRKLSGIPSCLDTLVKARNGKLPITEHLDELIKLGITSMKAH